MEFPFSVDVQLNKQQVRRAVMLSIEDALNSVGEWLSQKMKSRMEASGLPPSQPGQAPAIRTGTLRRSIFYTVSNRTLTIGSKLGYALYLEYGTRNMAMRPWLRPVVSLEDRSGALGRKLDKISKQRLRVRLRQQIGGR